MGDKDLLLAGMDDGTARSYGGRRAAGNSVSHPEAGMFAAGDLPTAW
jgi:hypothetical protein